MIPQVTTSSKYSVKINKALKLYFNQLVGEDKDLKMISAFRRFRNIKDLFVQSKLKPPNCKIKSINPKNGLYTLPKHPFEQNCVYLITCETCGMQNLRETSTSVKTRLNSHRYNITHRKKTNSSGLTLPTTCTRQSNNMYP